MKQQNSNLKTLALCVALTGGGIFSQSALAIHYGITLEGSEFEIEDPIAASPGANLVLDAGLTLDWENVIGTPDFAGRDDPDITVGSKNGDSSFGQGTSEDTEFPTVKTDSIPPNKSDLKKFGVYVEKTAGDDFLHMFWTRVQAPQGTTNMDFELNQSNERPSPLQDTAVENIPPVRTAGDLLIQYDLSGGGTRPTIWVARWITADSAAEDGLGAANAECEANNKYPCWGKRFDASLDGDASGSINNVAISHTDAFGLDEGMGFDPLTFGEASINLTNIVGEECTTFGSVYLKSRSSDAFNAALKDYVPPLNKSISNCAGVTLLKQDDAGTPLAGAIFELHYDTGEDGVYDGAVTDPVVIKPGTVSDPLTCGPTGDDGLCTFNNIFAGFYCAIETTTPDNHLTVDPVCFEVNPAIEEPEDIIVTDRSLGYILVKKVDEDGAELAGATFKVTDVDPAAVAADMVPDRPIDMNLLADQDAYFCAEDLPLNNASASAISYKVEETVVPAGYSGAEPQWLSPTAGDCSDAVSVLGSAVEFVNVSNNFKIIKKDDLGAVMNGVTFKLYNDLAPKEQYGDEDADTGKECTTGVGTAPDGVTDVGDGECWFKVVPEGDYCLVEHSDLADYIEADPQCFSFASGDEVGPFTFENRELGSILVKKVDQDGVELPDAGFTIQSASTGPDYDGLTLPTAMTLVADQTAYFCTDGLPVRDASGTTISYTVEETTVPDGYTGAVSQALSAVAGSCSDRGLTNPAVFENERKPGAIKITKYTKHYNSVQPVLHGGVGFEIYLDGVPIDTKYTGIEGEGLGVACLDGLTVDEGYTVKEIIPSGYAIKGDSEQLVTVTDDATCGSGDEDTVTFNNTPLGKFTITYHSLPEDGYGATKAFVTCTDANIPTTQLLDTEDVDSAALNFETNDTYHCTIVIDP